MSLRDRVRRSRVWPMLWKEFIQMRRDRLTLALIIGMPALQLLLFGYAVQTDVRHQPTVVLDESRTSESRALISTIANSGTFDVVGHVRSRDEVRFKIEDGTAKAALIIPPGFMADIKRGRTAEAQMIVNAADPQSAAAALAGAQLAAAARSVELAGTRRVVPLDLRVRPWYNPAQRSAMFIVPGVIGVLLTLTMTLITSTAIVRERERGTLEQLIVTPIDKTSLMLGKTIPFIVVGYAQMTVALFFGRVIFDIPLRGSLVLLYVVALVFILASLGVGLLISTVARTQAQAMQLSFFFMLPNILLSGYVFPREAMPEPAQWVGLALPLTYFLKVLRRILLMGVGTEHIWREWVTLFGIANVLLFVSIRRFSKTIE